MSPTHIHTPKDDKSRYSPSEKFLDFLCLASSPSLSKSTNTYTKILKKVEREKQHNVRLAKLKMNSFDERIFNASQQNKGVLTREVLIAYASPNFSSAEIRKSFLDYTNFRLAQLSGLGLLNDTSLSNKYYNEKTVIKGKEINTSVKLNYRYEVNSNFYALLQQYQQQKAIELKDKFEFGRFDAYIYNFLKKSSGRIDLAAVKNEKVQQALKDSVNITHQISLMQELGYLKEKEQGVFIIKPGIKERIVYLNPAEKKVIEFIERHGVFSFDKYRLDIEAEAGSYADILKGRLDKLALVGFIESQNGSYSFTSEGENQLKEYYAANYEFTSFDRNILNQNTGGIIELEEIIKELEGRYGTVSALQTFERQQERLFIMECAELVKRETSGIYTLTGKGSVILEEENAIHEQQRRELLMQTFKYDEGDEEFLNIIRSRAGTLHPKEEIEKALGELDESDGMTEFKTYNATMRGYKALGTEDIDRDDEAKQNIKLGYIMQHEDGTLSLTPKGKRLVNFINILEGERKQKAYGNKKVKLLNDIDRNFNRLNPEIYLKIQKIIKDKDLRKHVNLLRYKPERLYLAGLLDKNEDGSYSINGLYEQHSITFRQEEADNFNFSNVHKFMFKFCKNNMFSLEEYSKYLSKKHSGKTLEREMQWKKSSCEKLTEAGYFEKIDDNTYRLTPTGIEKYKELKDAQRQERASPRQGDSEDKPKEFAPGANHKYLLKFHKDGILDFKDVEERIKKLPAAKQQRELQMKGRMLEKLATAGYLEPLENTAGTYRLTQDALSFLNGGEDEKNNKSPPNTTKDRVEKVTKEEIKITKYDLDNIINPSQNGTLLKETVNQSPKKTSIEKRISTLTGAGMLIEKADGWILTGVLLDRAKTRENINLEHEKSHAKRHSMDCLTAEQRKTIGDIKDFLNLSGSQILKYIYNGNEKLYRPDIRYLTEKGILEKDSLTGVYTLSKQGTKIASDITGDNNIFHSKIHSRREELKHDVLVYTAFKETEKSLKAEGKIITAFRTDRQLRSEAAKNNGHMKGQYPDTYVEFKDEKTGEKGFVNIEVDVGYSEKEIEQKLKIPNLRWFTNSRSQREKVLRKAKYMYVKLINENYWKR